MAAPQIFGGLGKIYVMPDAIGPMNLQILRAHIKKSGGELVTTLDTSVSVICAHQTVSKEALQSQMKKSGASNAACVDVAWVSNCVRANQLLEPTVLLGKFCMPGQKVEVNVEIETTVQAQKRQIPGGGSETIVSSSKKVRTSECEVTISASTGAGTWHHDSKNLFVRWFSPDFKPSSKVAAFDMDGVIIVPKSKRKFPQNHHDWMLLREGILIKKLKTLIDEGHCIALISNQKGVQKQNPSVAQLSEKITNIQRALKVPIAFLAAYGSNEYRKPAPGMWEHLVREVHSQWQVDIDVSQSFYVGDAAGRVEGTKDWTGTSDKDFSDSDRKFALNAGLRFHCPESFFLGKPPIPYLLSGFDPSPYLLSSPDLPPTTSSSPPHGGPTSCAAAAATPAAAAAAATAPPPPPPHGGGLTSSAQEMVLLVGWPGSGKTTLAKAVFEPAGYAWVNRDTLKTPERCRKEAAAVLAQGRSVVVDNTNPSARARADYAALARARGVPVRCVRMAAPRELAEHLNRVRTMLGPGPGRPAHADVPPQAFHGYAAQFEEPAAAAEGLAEVVVAPFEPRFESEEFRRVFAWRL